MSDTKDMLSLANSRTERDIIFLGLSYLLPPRLRIQIQVFQWLRSENVKKLKSDRDLRYLTMVAQLRFSSLV